MSQYAIRRINSTDLKRKFHPFRHIYGLKTSLKVSAASPVNRTTSGNAAVFSLVIAGFKNGSGAADVWYPTPTSPPPPPAAVFADEQMEDEEERPLGVAVLRLISPQAHDQLTSSYDATRLATRLDTIHFAGSVSSFLINVVKYLFVCVLKCCVCRHVVQFFNLTWALFFSALLNYPRLYWQDTMNKVS